MPAILEGKVALVTGVSSDGQVGQTVAKVLAENGAALAICARTQSNVEERAEELRQAGARVLAVAASLTDEAQVRILGISTGYLRTSGHQVTWSFGTKDTYERTRRHNDLSRERPPEFPRAALLIRRFILCGARRVGAGGRNSGAIGATGGCCSNREEVSAPVAALSISPPCDDAGTSLGLPPIWRKGATSPPSVSIQP